MFRFRYRSLRAHGTQLCRECLPQPRQLPDFVRPPFLKIVMTDPEYMDFAEALLARIEARCDQLNETTDADIDNQRVGGMVTLAFADGSQIVVNLQKPLQEVWLASRSGGYHFRYQDGVWRDTKTGEDFFERLSASVSEHAGMPLTFSAS